MVIDSIDKYVLADMVEGADKTLAMSCETSEEYVVRKLLAAEDRVVELAEENSDLKKEIEKLKNSLKNCSHKIVRIQNAINDSENEENEEEGEE